MKKQEINKGSKKTQLMYYYKSNFDFASIFLVCIFIISLTPKGIAQNVGIGTTTPDHQAMLDIVSSDKGILIPRTDTSTINTAGTPSTGLIIYQSSNNKFYYFNGAKWLGLSTNDVAFERNGSTVRQVDNYDTDDFIFGRESIPDNGEIINDSLFFFDKSKAAFRGGKQFNNTYWSPDSIGFNSFSFGLSNSAMGEYSVSIGYSNHASGKYSTAFGFGTIADSGYETVIGTNNSLYTPVSVTGWSESDRLFTIGNGSALSRSNALTILKNGNTGIGAENPLSKLSVGGDGNSESTVYALNSDYFGKGAFFEASMEEGIGVYGLASNSNSYYTNYGGYFESRGEEGIGIFGLASKTGYAYGTGGKFEAYGEFGKGVSGYVTGSEGIGVSGSADYSGAAMNYGGYFIARGESGQGVYGVATNSGNVQNYGGFFEAKGSTGSGIYGEASKTGDIINYGGKFKAFGNSGYGVFGEAGGSYGKGVYGIASNSGDVQNYGGFFEAKGSTGRGIYGEASKTGDIINFGGKFKAFGDNGYGVFGEASGSRGIGVYGTASNTGLLTHYGGYFEAEGLNGWGLYSETFGQAGRGIYGYASHTSGVNYAVYGKTESSNGYAAYFEGKSYFSDKVGIGAATPSQTLDVDGKIKVSDDSNTPEAGNIRWNNDTQDFEGYNGNHWVSLVKGKADWGVSNPKNVEENVKLRASDEAPDDLFGFNVSISGDYAIIGAHRNDDNGNNSGAAYIFYNGNSWIEQAKLTASDASAEDNFGYSVSISGEYAIVGAPYNDDNGDFSGSAYIFHRTGTTWTEQAKLSASDATSGDKFGYSVSLSGEYVIIGAYQDDDNGDDSGSAYIFHRIGTTWTELPKLTAFNAAVGDEFGTSVAISYDYAFVGAPDDNNSEGIHAGSVYIFKRTGTTWGNSGRLCPTIVAENDLFGSSVSVSGDYLIVGAPRLLYYGFNEVGAAFIYHKIGLEWTEQEMIVPSDGAEDDHFGSSVSISGDYAIVGVEAKDDHGSQSGAAYIFERNGTTWTEQSKLNASDAASYSYFGRVSISGEYVIVGASGNDDTGSAYIFIK